MQTSNINFSAESLLTHVRVLCKDIGPRPAGSAQEHQAAEYVESTLRQYGVTNIERQPFKTQNSLGWVEIPAMALGMLGILLAMTGSLWGQWLGGLLLLVSAWVFYRLLFVQPPFFSRLIERWTSQNVIARIPAARQARKTVYLVGHLDTQKQRFQMPASPFWITRIQASLPVVVGVTVGVGLWVGAWRRYVASPYGLALLVLLYLYGLLGALYDETQPYVEGANDNASAVAVLLGTARALREHPLEATEVVLLFTGSEEVGCTGMENYLKRYAPAREDTFWIDIEMVGTGNLCYVTRHGLSYVSTYRPHPEMVALAEQAARKHPRLGVSGRPMVIIEEVANLRRWGYKAVCVAGYDAKGALPNWHRLSDNLSHIEPETLSRAASYVWALLQEIDAHDVPQG